MADLGLFIKKFVRHKLPLSGGQTYCAYVRTIERVELAIITYGRPAGGHELPAAGRATINISCLGHDFYHHA